MDDSNSFNWWVFFGILFFSYVLGLLWQALMHKVWGGKILKLMRGTNALYFKTGEGEFRLEKTHKKFSYKLKKQTTWQSIDYDELRQIYVFRSTDTASLIEFFMGDWGLWDMFGRYRDLINTYSIRLWTHKGTDVPVLTLKQYEQREWWLGQVFLAITISILKAFKLYRDGEDVAAQQLHTLQHLLAEFDLELTQRQ